MLKPIHRVDCSPALAACQQLMQRFALWLCDPVTSEAHISRQSLHSPVVANAIEGDWLWNFLQSTEDGHSLLSRAQTVAAMHPNQKAALANWIKTVSDVAAQFQPAPAKWPINCPLTSKLDWKAFKVLMEAFYKKGLHSGLPYLPNGTPAYVGGVTYVDYVRDFRNKHRLNTAPHAREVCVLCGGPLGDTPHVDHWIIKGAFPLLSVCADNLQLICSTCNVAPNKGKKPVYSSGSFTDWFHPYLSPSNGAVQLNYALPEFSVRCSAATPADQPKAAKLDALLNLTTRWTSEFKAEYAKRQKELAQKEQRRIRNGLNRHTLCDIETYVQELEEDLIASEPHYEVHKALAKALQEPSRLAAWHSELSLQS